MTPKFDRSPDNLTWAPDSSGIYFTADDSGSRNLHLAPLDGPITAVTKGVHLVSLSDVNKSGQAVGTLTSFHKPGDIISFSLSNPGVLKPLTNVNDDVLGDPARRRRGDLVHVARQLQDSGLAHQTA
jgi:hypothetical protein